MCVRVCVCVCWVCVGGGEGYLANNLLPVSTYICAIKSNEHLTIVKRKPIQSYQKCTVTTECILECCIIVLSCTTSHCWAHLLCFNTVL